MSDDQSSNGSIGSKSDDEVATEQGGQNMSASTDEKNPGDSKGDEKETEVGDGDKDLEKGESGNGSIKDEKSEDPEAQPMDDQDQNSSEDVKGNEDSGQLKEVAPPANSSKVEDSEKFKISPQAQPMKRRPVKELNHDNWDEEDEPEEKGEFTKASADQMKDRKVLTAKRKIVRPAGVVPSNPFQSLSFASFGAPTLTTTVSYLPKLIRNLQQRKVKRRSISPLWRLMMLTTMVAMKSQKTECASVSASRISSSDNSATNV